MMTSEVLLGVSGVLQEILLSMREPCVSKIEMEEAELYSLKNSRQNGPTTVKISFQR